MDILIIEDDKWTENSLVYLLKKNFKSINSISCANTIVKAKNHLLRKNTDLVFADVELGKDIVFELIKEMNLKFPYLIIISSHKKYALESIRYNAIDYLLKPIEINALTLAYKKVEKRNKANLFNDKQHPKSLFIGIKENKKIKIINFSDIIYLKKNLIEPIFNLVITTK
jgi:two-component system LytT family response regulator